MLQLLSTISMLCQWSVVLAEIVSCSTRMVACIHQIPLTLSQLFCRCQKAWHKQHSGLSSSHQIPRLFQVFPRGMQTGLCVLLREFCGTIGSPPCACQLYLTVLRLCLFCDYRNCGSTPQANHNFPDFSVTNVKLPDFSRFSGRVATMKQIRPCYYYYCYYFQLLFNITAQFFQLLKVRQTGSQTASVLELL